jgi:hypothetical protein
MSIRNVSFPRRGLTQFQLYLAMSCSQLYMPNGQNVFFCVFFINVKALRARYFGKSRSFFYPSVTFVWRALTLKVSLENRGFLDYTI